MRTEPLKENVFPCVTLPPPFLLQIPSERHSLTLFFSSSPLPKVQRILFLCTLLMDLITPPLSPGLRSPVKTSSQPRSTKWYLDSQLELYERETSTGGLLQNCDLPPPLRVFPVKGYDGKKGIRDTSPAIPAQKRTAPAPAPMDDQMDHELGSKHGSSENSRLLRALQLSQTRAREAEKAALLANKQNRQMAVLILEDSMRLYAHRQWVKLLETEVSMLEKGRLMTLKEEVKDEDDAEPTDSWCLALALCLGIASLGFVFGRCICPLIYQNQ